MTWGRPRSTKTLLETIWDGVNDENGPDACHPWERALTGNGFPALKYHGTNIRVHRHLMCHFLPRPDMAALVVGHTCGNRACCNLAHLRWEDRSAACLRAVEAGTVTGGKPKLSDAQVIEARARLRKGAALVCDLADKAGVAGGTLRAAASGMTHKKLNQGHPPFAGTLPLGNAGRGGHERPRNYSRPGCKAFMRHLASEKSTTN